MYVFISFFPRKSVYSHKSIKLVSITKALRQYLAKQKSLLMSHEIHEEINKNLIRNSPIYF